MTRLTICVTGTVDVTVMPLTGLVLDMGCVDSDTTSFLFWSLVDLRVVDECRIAALGQDFGDGCG